LAPADVDEKFPDCIIPPSIIYDPAVAVVGFKIASIQKSQLNLKRVTDLKYNNSNQ
jgi:hypothetical protein